MRFSIFTVARMVIEMANVFQCSQMLHIKYHRKRTPPALNYTLGNTLLNVVNSHSYLGVTVCSNLRWHEHVNNVSAKAIPKLFNFIRGNVSCCPPHTKATAYISLVRSHLEYAAAAWDPYFVGDCKQLEKVQRRAARFVKRDYRSFLNLAGKPSLIVEETVTYHSCTRVFTVWLVFPPHLFVVLQSPLVQMMTTHFVSCPLEPILTSTPSVLVPLLTGMSSRHQ